MKEMKDDAFTDAVMSEARKACDLCGVTPTSDMRIHAEYVAATAILMERNRNDPLHSINNKPMGKR